MRASRRKAEPEPVLIDDAVRPAPEPPEASVVRPLVDGTIAFVKQRSAAHTARLEDAKEKILGEFLKSIPGKAFPNANWEVVIVEYDHDVMHSLFEIRLDKYGMRFRTKVKWSSDTRHWDCLKPYWDPEWKNNGYQDVLKWSASEGWRMFNTAAFNYYCYTVDDVLTSGGRVGWK